MIDIEKLRKNYCTDSYTVTVYYRDGAQEVYAGLHMEPSPDEARQVLKIEQITECRISGFSNGIYFRSLRCQRIPIDTIKRWTVEMHPGVASPGLVIIEEKKQSQETSPQPIEQGKTP